MRRRRRSRTASTRFAFARASATSRIRPLPAMPPASRCIAISDREQLRGIEKLADFPQTGSRELVADDYIYQIKRLAHPRLHSPIFSMMSRAHRRPARVRRGAAGGGEEAAGRRLAGPRSISARRRQPRRSLHLPHQPARQVSAVRLLAGDAVLRAGAARGRPFLQHQPGMAEKNLTLDWYPVGTGPFMLTENNPNSRMVLARNPNFHGETYPCEGEPGDEAAGLLADCGKPLPFIDKAVFRARRRAFPTGTSSCRAITMPPGFPRTASTRRCDWQSAVTCS
jgi:oligopeptide transport system substrate-binding protein